MIVLVRVTLSTQAAYQHPPLRLHTTPVQSTHATLALRPLARTGRRGTHKVVVDHLLQAKTGGQETRAAWLPVVRADAGWRGCHPAPAGPWAGTSACLTLPQNLALRRSPAVHTAACRWLAAPCHHSLAPRGPKRVLPVASTSPRHAAYRAATQWTPQAPTRVQHPASLKVLALLAVDPLPAQQLHAASQPASPGHSHHRSSS